LKPRIDVVKPKARLALFFGTALLYTCAALAQTIAPAGDAGVASPPQVQSADGVEYINGGAGEEARAAIDARRGAFPLRLVFSLPSGAYVVADHVDVSNARGKVLGVDGAGPILLVKVPPGEYSVEARYGGKVERRAVRVGRDGTTVNWRWPEEARR
jgi:hypothetical protein